MVSIRRRRLLGLCSGNSSFSSPLVRCADKEKGSGNVMHDTRPVTVHPLPLATADQLKEDSSSNVHLEPSNPSGSTSSKEQQTQKYPEVKRRKKYRRKQVDNQEPCLMRGVYFKNMKWQAAIKVDKKQIHLGTVVSQEEAARLYDRAAFICGRETNFVLSEEEKQELSRYKWDEYLADTRSAIARPRKRIRAGTPVNAKLSMNHSDWEVEQGKDNSPSEDAEPDMSSS